MRDEAGHHREALSRLAGLDRSFGWREGLQGTMRDLSEMGWMRDEC